MFLRQIHWLARCRRAFLVVIVWEILLLALPLRATALDPQRPLSQALLRIWQAQQGLPRAAILSIRQSRDGYLWLGTQAGLYRFDGVRFVAVSTSMASPSANVWIKDLAEDRESHQLWLASDGEGLLTVRAPSSGEREIEKQLSADVNCLLVTRDGRLAVGTNEGLAIWQDDRLVMYRTQDGLPDEHIFALGEAADGKLWIGAQGPYLASWDGSSFETVELASLPHRATIQALHWTPDGILWIATSAGLVRRSEQDERLLTTADGLGNDMVYCLAGAKSGGLWVGTKEGLGRIQGERVERFQTRDGLSQSTVYALCEDHEGSLWIGTKHGLNQLVDRRTLLPFTVSEGLPSNDAGPILQDDTGRIWVGTLGAGLAQFDGRKFVKVAGAATSLLSNTVLSLANGKQGELWIGTDKGLCRMEAGQIAARLTTAQGLPSPVVRCLCRDKTGALWVGTASGLVEFREGRFVPPQGDDALRRLPVQALVDYRGEYLVVSLGGGGLFRLADGTLSPLADDLQLPGEVDAFYLDADERLWMAIRGRGLGLFDGKRVISVGVKDGLYDDDIFGIAGDDRGRLWMACSRGIFSVPRAELQQFAAGEIAHVSSSPFSPTDALRTIECQDGVQPAIAKMQDGRVWFSTIRGFMMIDPERATRPLPRAPVVIEEMRVNGQETDPHRVKQLQPGQNNLEFHYTALSFVSPSRIRFYYRLEGFDKDWIDAGKRREAFYTNLRPGSYRFFVKATNADGSSNEAVEPIAFVLQPYYYQRQWFWPLVVAGFVGLSGLGYRLRIRQVKDRLEAVLAERSRIARELHDTLIQGFSGVTMQMQALAARLQKSPERETLTDIIHDAGGCLSEARRSVAGLRNPEAQETGLAAAIAQTARQLTETADIRLRLRLEPVAAAIDSDVEYNLLRIVQEAIANAIKHAAPSVVEVALRRDGLRLKITIRDDGVGFDAEETLEHVRPGHYGLVGMRERAVQIGAEASWQSAPKQGTTVVLTLPLTPGGKSIREAAPPERLLPEELPLRSAP
jgi:signal transduction histidine kinase/ligand-binding sensor domain-containing protein